MSNETKPVFSFRLPVGLKAILSDPALGDGPADITLSLIANGLKLVMMRHSKPVSEKFLDRLNSDGLLKAYAEFVDAVNNDAGLTQHRYIVAGKFRFEKTPANSVYYVPGAETYLVLSANEKIDPLTGKIWRQISQ